MAQRFYPSSVFLKGEKTLLLGLKREAINYLFSFVAKVRLIGRHAVCNSLFYFLYLSCQKSRLLLLQEVFFSWLYKNTDKSSGS